MSLIKISSIICFLLLISGCQTNPPVYPEKEPTGNISLTLRINNSIIPTTVNKTVLIEYFTNVGCTPCPIVNRMIAQLSRNTYGSTKLATVKFPVNFPAPNDIFYLAAKEICDFRRSYYNVFFAPNVIVDGILKPIAIDSIKVKQAIDSRLQNDPLLSIDVSTTLKDNYEIIITIGITDSASINIDELLINTAITESDIIFEKPPGSNGETEFYDVIRLLLPSVNGIPLRDLYENNELKFEFEDAILSTWNQKNMNTIVYIQNVETKEIYQTGSSF